MTNEVGFPGLGIGDFTISSKVFPNAAYSIAWYGVIIAVGFFLAVLYTSKRAPDFGYKSDDVIDMLIFAVPAGIIGARLFYVIFEWKSFKHDLSSIVRIWDGGIAIYGAIIFSAITCVLFCRIKRFNIGSFLDLGGMGLLIGQAVGRWGNFFNGEVYGMATDLPWRMRLNGIEVHPLFLYESLWDAAGFLMLHILSKKRKYNGQIFLLYAAWYGLGRGLLEAMRAEQYILTAGSLKASQLVGFTSCAAALLILAYNMIFRKSAALREESSALADIEDNNSDATEKPDENNEQN